MNCIINPHLFTFHHNQSIQHVLHSLQLHPKPLILQLNKQLINQHKYQQYTLTQDHTLQLLQILPPPWYL
ncbi:ubiquitin family protein, partial [Staphylococcus epidermidis]|uniref:thiamine biosynthesis protein ThiS n=1 Tax=Staphylococcus epidermidis TaxID=1282 RepID=UPI0011A2FF0B